MPTPLPPPPEMTVEGKSRFVDHIGNALAHTARSSRGGREEIAQRHWFLVSGFGAKSKVLSEAELRDELHYIETQLSSNNQDSSFGLTVFTSAMTGLEMSTSVCGIQIYTCSIAIRTNTVARLSLSA